ncbi:hypothetical protein ATCV1_z299L [Acanthocystis turfacea chlorella virus 1]|uniref:Uncharacterized protein z299L n=1 Tax=Chlorovirus heliozoae TaxID=322019 RepID=A7K8Q9_9PHYC|nr:hypothetical protein ATCV1_z299L [Acanthocystis turfacea chlorella virus 1]ABT16433.1 hypothetical protein ATCV1_z299L [Acanthocystis turfacea chlorella virus 1]
MGLHCRSRGKHGKLAVLILLDEAVIVRLEVRVGADVEVREEQEVDHDRPEEHANEFATYGHERLCRVCLAQHEKSNTHCRIQVCRDKPENDDGHRKGHSKPKGDEPETDFVSFGLQQVVVGHDAEAEQHSEERGAGLGPELLKQRVGHSDLMIFVGTCW